MTLASHGNRTITQRYIDVRDETTKAALDLLKLSCRETRQVIVQGITT